MNKLYTAEGSYYDYKLEEMWEETVTAYFENPLKRTVFWDIMPCIPLKVNRPFGGIYRLHLQDRKISRARNQRESRWQAMYSSETLVVLQRTTRRYIPKDITTAVRTSNPTLINFVCSEWNSTVIKTFSRHSTE
jgi:hypothetical protein